LVCCFWDAVCFFVIHNSFDPYSATVQSVFENAKVKLVAETANPMGEISFSFGILVVIDQQFGDGILQIQLFA